MTQMIRSMTMVLSWFGNVEPWRTALGPSCHRVGDGEHRVCRLSQGYAGPTKDERAALCTFAVMTGCEGAR